MAATSEVAEFATFMADGGAESVVPQTDAARIFARQKAAHRADPVPSLKERKANLLKLEQLLVDNQQAICEAISKDFGNRAHQETKLLELFLSVDGLRDCRKRLRKWIKPQRRGVSIWFAGGRNRVIPQPKGVVGIAAPWNYPLFLVMGPLASALAAGNRCMIKMAANSLHLRELLHRLLAERFDEDTVALLPAVSGSEFSSLAFDHLVFTGSAETGRTVMRAAAANLTPVTLELGGKSPTIIADDFDPKTAAERIMQMKCVNAGQTCVAPDYLFIPAAKLAAFIAHCKAVVAKRYPRLDSPDYTSIINATEYDRLRAWIDDASSQGAEMVSLIPDASWDAASRKIAPHLAINADEQMLLLQQEIFGPILPIKTYQNLDEVIDYINDRDRPLALYLFSNQKSVQQRMITLTQSGGVAINDCGLHVAQHDLPFGGSGASGMGHYHGHEGFVEFSKMRPVFKQFAYPAFPLLSAPYGKRFDWIFSLMIKLK